jgi:disulfide bond formation protein DsbB
MYLEDIFTLSAINFACSVGGLALFVFTLVLVFDYVCNRSSLYKKYIQVYAWQLMMLVTLGSIALSLVYSEYFGFVPCSLCWLQRTALYPQALFVLMAFKSKERVCFPLYSGALSLFGLLVALYHYVYQMLPKETLTSGIVPCLADGSADCADKIINEFGFVTFPLLSAITFAFLLAMYAHMRREG